MQSDRDKKNKLDHKIGNHFRRAEIQVKYVMIKTSEPIETRK